MLHTENEWYRLFYRKGYQKNINKVTTYFPSTWYVEDNNDNIVWKIEGKLLPIHTRELVKTFGLIVKLN